MKTKLAHLMLYPLLAIPLAITAQPTNLEEALSDIIVVEDGNLSGLATDPTQPAMVVEIPDAAIDGARLEQGGPGIPELAGPQVGMPEVVLELPGQDGVLSGTLAEGAGNTLSVDFLDEDVRTILRNVADLSELNLVIPDALQGRTSLKLRNISWQQLFEVVLDPLGFTYIIDRGIIRIKSIDEIATEPTDTRVFVVSNAVASEISGSIETLVDAAAGGRIIVDSRSNSLVITERPSRMNKIQEIINNLDRPNHQVMIESRFVDVNKVDARDLGLDWAFISDRDLPAGTGGVFDPSDPNTPYDGAAFGGFTQPIGAASGMLAVFSEKDFAVTINALDDREDTKLVSNPTVVVMNNKNAVLEVGDDFPLRQFTVNPETGLLEAGEIEYRFVGIKLEVTPSVNAEGMITLDVRPEVSERLEGQTVPGPNGLQDQIFRTRNAQTQVTIKDGYTIALGGLTRETTTLANESVPFLGDIPVFGKLFQNNERSVGRSNLIIFLTAKTLNPDGTTYREIIDPRKLNDVGHTPSQTPGYQLPADQLELLREAEESREAIEVERLKERLKNETTDNQNFDKPWVDRELKRKSR